MKNKGWIVRIIADDDLTIIMLFRLFRIGLIHPPGLLIKGVFFGINKLEIQLTVALQPKETLAKQMGEDIGHA